MSDKNNIQELVSLTIAKIEILKLKANDHDWQCYIKDDVKEQLLSALKDIDLLINSIGEDDGR